MTINFYAGERKEVSGRIVLKNPDEVIVISSARYELIDKNYNIVENGSCEVDNDMVTVLLGINQCGRYELKFIVQVGKETIIEKATVFVG